MPQPRERDVMRELEMLRAAMGANRLVLQALLERLFYIADIDRVLLRAVELADAISLSGISAHQVHAERVKAEIARISGMLAPKESDGPRLPEDR